MNLQSSIYASESILNLKAILFHIILFHVSYSKKLSSVPV